MERVAKIMARRGLCSRREAERLIAAGHVRVNGVVVNAQGSKAPLDAAIVLDPAAHEALGARLTVLLHKPVGVVSTLPEPGQIPAWRLLRAETVVGRVDRTVLARVLDHPAALAVAGRLDRASRGLLVLTEDGTVARHIVGAHMVQKEYLVRTDRSATEAQLRKLGGSLRLDGQVLKPMTVERVDANVLRFVLVEGRKHQLRRVCRHVGLHVVDLFRIAIGPLRIEGLPESSWRFVNPDELRRLICHNPADADVGP
jgi:23S rRNA pseudouridine2604 synthase